MLKYLFMTGAILAGLIDPIFFSEFLVVSPFRSLHLTLPIIKSNFMRDYVFWSAIGACVVLIVIVVSDVVKKMKKEYPPGPPGLPFIGNIWRLPAVNPWHKLTEWKHEFGELSIPNGCSSNLIL